MRFALVSREVFPFGGGGIGEYVAACARLLVSVGEVKIFTTSAHEASYRSMAAAGDLRLPPPGVEVIFVPEPTPAEIGGFYSYIHLYSARILDRLREVYGTSGPDLVEFSDYLGEGCVTVQARRSDDPMLRRTTVGIRTHTTAEICAILDGYLADEFEARVTCEMERLALRDADLMLWPGGDCLSLYRRFYRNRLAPAVRIRNPFANPAEMPGPEVARPHDEPLRLLYLGRLERRKGVQNLLRGVSSLERDDWRLTVLGGDTDTAPLGVSVGAQLRLMAADDPRIDFRDAVPRSELGALVREHDAVVLPSLWECWPYVALEALRLNRPILATPTGGFCEMVQPGRSGWLTEELTAGSLADAVERLLVDREAADLPRLSGGPRAVLAELTDEEEIAEGYRDIVRRGRPHRARPARITEPLVSAVVPYYRLHEFLPATIESILAQTYRPIEVIVVNDGSLRDVDWVLAELSARFPITVLTQINSGLGAARNFGVKQSRGRYVMPLDADNVIEPDFVERCVGILESDPSVAFVTSWSRYIDEHGEELPAPNIGYQPFGNASTLIAEGNVAGDAAAVIRRRVFDLGHWYSEDLTSYEDWHFYRDLHHAGRYGLVVPDRLLRYRVREDSMIREVGFKQTRRLHGEMFALDREKEVQWTSTNG